MIKSDCNGFTNHETWNINLMYEEVFINMAEEQEYEDLESMADFFKSLVEELEYEGVKPGSLAESLLRMYLHQVDWEEIAGHYFEEAVEEEEVEA
jgi:hypothetical protein